MNPPNDEEWLSPEAITKKYPVMTSNGMCEKMIKQLFRANLLRGYYCPSNKKIFINERSFIALAKHINFTLQLKHQPLDGEKYIISTPDYSTYRPNVYKEDWTRDLCSIDDLLEKYDNLNNNIYNPAFIKKIALLDILIWRMGENSTIMILLASFETLMEYHNYTVRQNLIIRR